MSFQAPFSIKIQKVLDSIKVLSINFSDRGIWISDGKAIYFISLEGMVHRQDLPMQGEVVTINEKHNYIIVGNKSSISSIDFQGNLRWKFPLEGIPTWAEDDLLLGAVLDELQSVLGGVHSVLFIPKKNRIFTVVDSHRYKLNLLCFSIEGQLLWGRRPENKITEVIAAHEGELIICNSPNRIYAWGNQGNLLWICSADLHKDTGGFLEAEKTDHLCFAKNAGVIYFASLIMPSAFHYEYDIARVHCCDTKGILQWQRQVQGKILGLSSTDNGEVVVGTYLKKIYYFDRNGIPVWEKTTPGAVWCVDVCKDGSYVVVAGYQDWVIFYDHSGRLIKEYKTRGDTIRFLKISPNCQTIAAFGDNLYLFQAQFK
jgi:WD40 repeat protein